LHPSLSLQDEAGFLSGRGRILLHPLREMRIEKTYIQNACSHPFEDPRKRIFQGMSTENIWRGSSPKGSNDHRSTESK
ncbi:MAG: hypothetical protein ACP5J1_07370, partial [Fervidicoccaceae archaeon]